MSNDDSQVFHPETKMTQLGPEQIMCSQEILAHNHLPGK